MRFVLVVVATWLSLGVAFGQANKPATDANTIRGQMELGAAYADGRGVPQDYKKAAEIFQRFADLHVPLALVNLGWLYECGTGVPRDYKKAAQLYREASDRGYSTGTAYLAHLYARGDGVPLNYAIARELFERAVDEQPSAYVCNECAWFLATCRDPAQRNAKKAVGAAVLACRMTKWRNANFVGTLAAAYAESGDFKQAARYAQQALDMGGLEPAHKEELKGNLALYRQGKAVRE